MWLTSCLLRQQEPVVFEGRLNEYFIDFTYWTNMPPSPNELVFWFRVSVNKMDNVQEGFIHGLTFCLDMLFVTSLIWITNWLSEWYNSFIMHKRPLPFLRSPAHDMQGKKVNRALLLVRILIKQWMPLT